MKLVFYSSTITMMHGPINIRDTLHVSDGLSVHHQFKTVHTATDICHTDTAVCLLASRQQYLFDCCCMYSLELLMMDGKTETCRVSFQIK